MEADLFGKVLDEDDLLEELEKLEEENVAEMIPGVRQDLIEVE
jgi:hypothetical protein